jgi:hypothetical protein
MMFLSMPEVGLGTWLTLCEARQKMVFRGEKCFTVSIFLLDAFTNSRAQQNPWSPLAVIDFSAMFHQRDWHISTSKEIDGMYHKWSKTWGRGEGLDRDVVDSFPNLQWCAWTQVQGISTPTCGQTWILHYLLKSLPANDLVSEIW